MQALVDTCSTISSTHTGSHCIFVVPTRMGTQTHVMEVSLPVEASWCRSSFRENVGCPCSSCSWTGAFLSALVSSC